MHHKMRKWVAYEYMAANQQKILRKNNGIEKIQHPSPWTVQSIVPIFDTTDDASVHVLNENMYNILTKSKMAATIIK